MIAFDRISPSPLPMSGMLFAAFMTLGACDRPAHQTQATDLAGPVLTKLIQGDDFPRFHTDSFQYGSELPAGPVGGLTQHFWKDWARQAWPKACNHVQLRRLTARMRKDRQCSSEGVQGIVPVESMRTNGYLDVGDTPIPVVWKWSRTPGKDKLNCENDPISGKQATFIITRSSDFRNWQVSKASMKDDSLLTLEPDGVWETCGRLTLFLK